MKLKKLYLAFALFVPFQAALGQTLTDKQILNFAKQRSASGADINTITAELLKRGATQEQLSTLKANYSNNPMEVTTPAGAADVERGRVNNGEKNAEKDKAEAKTAGERRVFGHDIFRSKLLSFEPNSSVAVAPTYVLGPGDEVIIDVFGASQVTNKLKVAPDGSINIPRIGPVNVSGLTVDRAQSQIHAAMGKHYQNASIKLSVGQTRTMSINVMGEVKVPGTYTLSAFATVFHALYMAGGINDVGTLREVKVVRNGRVISVIDVYDYIMSGKLTGNIRLNDNDVIIVGSYQNLVNISGNVKRPMWYEMKKDESLRSLLDFCSGFTGNAYTKNIKVTRSAGDKMSVYSVDEFNFTSFRLCDEDQVFVQGNEKRYSNLVSVNGAVKRPGEYELDAAKTLKGLLELAGGLDDNAMTTRAVILRMNENRTLKTITVNLKGIVNGTEPDVALKNEDVLRIATIANITSERKMTITGEVWNPGEFDFSENTSIEDLITLAGGLKESASLLNVEVSRRIIDPMASSDSIVKSQTFTYNLSENLEVSKDNTLILRPYDVVSIRRSPVYEAQQTVTLEGEVVFGGNYTLNNDRTRLSDVIKRAGGLKKNAYVRNARLVRVMDANERDRMNQFQELIAERNDSLVADSYIAKTEYNVAIDLEEAMKNPGSSADLILRNGDRIIVPQQLNTVKISGEVLYPNDITFMEGKGKSYYINEAGGYTKKAQKRRAYIVYANGHVSKLSKGKIESGCEIVVPKKEQKDHSNDVSKWISITTALATVGALLISVLK